MYPFFVFLLVQSNTMLVFGRSDSVSSIIVGRCLRRLLLLSTNVWCASLLGDLRVHPAACCRASPCSEACSAATRQIDATEAKQDRSTIFQSRLSRPVGIPSLSNRPSARERGWGWVGAPHHCSLGAAPCNLLFMLTRAMLMPSLFQRTSCRSSLLR